MHKKAIIPALAALLGYGITSPGLAEPAHRHGVADLDIAFSGQEIAIELHSPANNILGFEHAPKNDAEEERLAEGLARLREAHSLFGLPDAAGCKLESVKIDNPFEPLSGHEHDGHHDKEAGHEGDHHGGYHETGHGAGDKSEHGHEEHEQETHADISVSYRYHCRQPGRLDGIKAQGLFQHFPGFEKLKARWVGDRGQSAAMVTRGNTRIQLRGM